METYLWPPVLRGHVLACLDEKDKHFVTGHPHSLARASCGCRQLADTTCPPTYLRTGLEIC
jgi:hypothetical protein